MPELTPEQEAIAQAVSARVTADLLEKLKDLLPANPYMDITDVMGHYKIKAYQTVANWEKNGKIPRRIAETGHPRWRRSDIASHQA